MMMVCFDFVVIFLKNEGFTIYLLPCFGVEYVWKHLSVFFGGPDY